MSGMRPREGVNLCLFKSESLGGEPALAPPREKLPPRDGVNRERSSSLSYKNNIKCTHGYFRAQLLDLIN